MKSFQRNVIFLGTLLEQLPVIIIVFLATHSITLSLTSVLFTVCTSSILLEIPSCRNASAISPTLSSFSKQTKPFQLGNAFWKELFQLTVQ